MFHRQTDLSHGLNSFDEADEDYKPGTTQTHHHPPLQGAAGINIRCDIQGFTIPKIAH